MCSIECTKNLLVDLRTLGKIEEGKKINTKEKYISSDDTTFLQPLWRWYRGDSRISTGNKIEKVLTCSSNLIEKAVMDVNNGYDDPKDIYIKIPPSKFLDDIRVVLVQANAGVKNLRDTYVQDDTISSKLEMHIQTLGRQIEIINETLKNTKEESDAKKERRFSFSQNDENFNSSKKKKQNS
jgi:hypothetical protein